MGSYCLLDGCIILCCRSGRIHSGEKLKAKKKGKRKAEEDEDEEPQYAPAQLIQTNCRALFNGPQRWTAQVCCVSQFNIFIFSNHL